MSHQTLNGAPPSPTVGDVTTQASSLAHDLITLAELQARLLYVDVREAGTRSAASGVILAGMLALSLASLIVLLFGAGDWIGEANHWPRGAGHLLVGGIGAIFALATGWFTFKRLRRVTAVFGRTQQELQDNLEFVKALVGGSDEDRYRQQRRF